MKRTISFLKPATRAFFREGKKTKNYSVFDALHGYIYGRWIYQYISIGTGEHPLSKLISPVFSFFSRLAVVLTGEKKTTFADTYHAKVVSLEGARQLVTVNKPVRILDLEQVVPYAKARDIILSHPDHIVALDCPCRSARSKPCLPLDVCLVVGEPFAAFILEHHPAKSRAISQSEALETLEAEHKRGHVHHAFFKEATLNRFYAVCNCCSCCCGAIGAMKHGIPMLASSGFVATVDLEKCVQCGRCVSFCQFDALWQEEKQVHFDEAKCLGCGVCVDICKKGARDMKLAPERGVPLEIRKLMNEATSSR
ncbi:MAG: 4Fe-4S binding protein [Thermodesulfobacteriota bacterium]